MIISKKKKVEKTAKRKSIKSKIMLDMSLVVTVSLLLVGMVSSVLNSLATDSILEQTLSAAAVVTAQSVHHQLESYMNIAGEVGSMARLSALGSTLKSKQDILQQKVDLYGLKGYKLLDANGISLEDGSSAADKDYFQDAIQGNTHISEPIVAGDGELIIVVAAPIWQDGIVNNRIVGVVAFLLDSNALNEIVASVNVSKNGYAYMLDSNGTTIAHIDMEKVIKYDNTIEAAKTNRALETVADIARKMISGDSGFSQYTYGGETKVVAYAPIEDSEGWSIAVSAPVSDFKGMSRLAILLNFVITVISIIVAVFFALKLSQTIAKPLQKCAERLKLMSEGDFDTPVPEAVTNDEIGEMLTSAGIVVRAISNIIKDVDYVLDSMSNGDYTVTSTVPESYIGSFEGILNSMQRMKLQMSETISQIRMSANQITIGSMQVSDGAQSLAQGATEQASSIEELASSIDDISSKITDNSDNAKKANILAENCGDVAKRTLEDMNQMLGAMNEISVSSEEIRKIIKVIDDIAFQTNILALNAAVEAARAGAAGKGFAVVADEVRNLAAKSAEAAKNTTGLIESSIVSVSDGEEIVKRVHTAFEELEKSITETVSVVDKITKASEEQAVGIQQISTGMDQISSVVQTTSATSEESAATSQELSGQASMLDRIMQKFKLENK